MNDIKQKPLSTLHSIAENFLRDGQDYANRFDVLWENQTHKTGRIKSFVDLLLSCECAMKCHVALGRIGDNPLEVYYTIRSCNHRIAPLASAATFLADRSTYEQLTVRLQQFPVSIRYSLDAYEAFFPAFAPRQKIKIDYISTIGNNGWVQDTRLLIDLLLRTANEVFLGTVPNDIEAIFRHELDMNEVRRQYKTQSKRKRP